MANASENANIRDTKLAHVTLPIVFRMNLLYLAKLLRNYLGSMFLYVQNNFREFSLSPLFSVTLLETLLAHLIGSMIP